MDHVKDDELRQQAANALIAELRHWREVSGISQKALASLVRYTPSYISKVEGGALVPSREFIESADGHLRAGGALLRRWKALRDVGENLVPIRTRHHRLPTILNPPRAMPL